MQISKAVLSLVQFLACSALGPSLGGRGGGEGNLHEPNINSMFFMQAGLSSYTSMSMSYWRSTLYLGWWWRPPELPP